MQWSGGRRSSNVEDRRGMGPVAIGGGLGTLVLMVLALIWGVEPRDVATDNTVPGALPATAPDDEIKDFVSAVMGYTEDTWAQIFREQGERYRRPTLVLYTGAARSACGLGQAAMGPFY